MTRRAKPHVLIVDDEPHILGLLQELLEDEGFVVDCAADGHEAMRIIERRQPHLVISDLMMPRISGTELVNWIHTAQRGPRPNIILMSAARESGPSTSIPFIRKPFDIDEMLDMVQQVIRSRAS
jgi:DNA-binding response OmpR family regulator